MAADTVSRSLSHQARLQFNRQPLLFVALACVIGIIIDASLGSVTSASSRIVAWLVTAIVAILGLWLLRRTVHPWPALLLGLVLPAAGVWHAHHDRLYLAASVRSILTNEPAPVILEGTTEGPVRMRPNPLARAQGSRDADPWQSQLEVSITSVKLGDQMQRLDGRLLVVCEGQLDDIWPGDQLRIYGKIQAFAAPSNPGERDLRPYYERQRLHGRVDCQTPDQIEVVGQAAPFGLNAIHRFFARASQSGRETISRTVSPANQPLALALVLGQREMIEQQARDSLLETGTAHLLSVSGLHLAIVVGLVAWICFRVRIPGSIRMALVLAVCLAYTLITGARPPVIRAAVLVIALVTSMIVKRPRQPLNILCAAAIFLMARNPSDVFGVGTQLSFLAVATLMLSSRRLNRRGDSVAESLEREQRLDRLATSAMSGPVRWMTSAWVRFGQGLWFSGCVTMVSLPLVWYQFNIVSLVSILANVVVGSLLMFALPAGVVAVGLGWIFAPLAIMPGQFCSWFLSAIQQVIHFFSVSLPYGHRWLPSPPAWWVAGFYIGIVIWLIWYSRRYAKLGWFVGGWGLLGYVLATTPTELQKGELQVAFVDVGHGTCAIVRASTDETWLYDCGRMANSDGSSRDIDTALWSMGIAHLDGIFLSHADADHYNAVPGVLRRFKVDRIIAPAGLIETDEQGLVPLREAIDRYQVPIETVHQSDKLMLGEHTAQVLHPPEGGVDGSDNANSLTLMIVAGTTPLLLPGDLESPGTESLLDLIRPESGGVLMAPHHGSLSADARKVIQWARPSETIVSGGKRAERPAVRDMLSFAGSGVHVTSREGAIRVTIDANGQIDVQSWNGKGW